MTRAIPEFTALARADLDASRVRAVVTEAVATALKGDVTRRALSPGWDTLTLETFLRQALEDGVGAFAGWFRWSANDGGLVTGYCCHAHSLLVNGERGVETIERVVAAVVELHAVLRDLLTRFDALHARTQAMPLEQAVEHVASELVLYVVERNGANEAWHTTFVTLMAWYLESIGVDATRVAELVTAVAEQRFRSWVVPQEDDRLEAAKEIGLEVAIAVEREATSVRTEDALSEWRAVREAALEGPVFAKPMPGGWDAHARFIETVEHARDPVRAKHMRVALTSARARAKRGEPLTFELLARFAGMVLGQSGPAVFRTGDAFAKDGRERYALDASTRARFSHWLAQANEPATSVFLRAARVYLDVCFTHPFEDANARVARIALDFVLAREGFMLTATGPVFALSRSASDLRGLHNLANVVARACTRLP